VIEALALHTGLEVLQHFESTVLPSGGEGLVVRHASGVAPVRTTLPPREAMRHQLEMFARAVRGEADYPIPFPDLLATVASFEATVKSVETSRTVEVTRT
jgi:predicted dehydrogenase